jgi:hypothetical protein
MNFTKNTLPIAPHHNRICLAVVELDRKNILILKILDASGCHF